MNLSERLTLALMRDIKTQLIGNYDTDRFGEDGNVRRYIIERLAYLVRKQGFFHCGHSLSQAYGQIAENMEGLEYLDSVLSDQASKDLLVTVLAFRVLGYEKIRLPLGCKEYRLSVERNKAKAREAGAESVPGFTFKIYPMKLDCNGQVLELLTSPAAVSLLEEFDLYSLPTPSGLIGPTAGDIVLDCGGCWGDTAVWFAAKAGNSGQVHSFEFAKNNLHVFRRNLELNPGIKGRVKICERPVSNTSGKKLVFSESGPGTRLSNEDGKPHDGSAVTISVDDYVAQEGINRVDFIKMDIEGSECDALLGARDTISRFKPKVAICLYHSLEDFGRVPRILLDHFPGYKFHLAHHSMNAEETVLYGIAAN